jgi:hypothetical protein
LKKYLALAMAFSSAMLDSVDGNNGNGIDGGGDDGSCGESKWDGGSSGDGDSDGSSEAMKTTVAAAMAGGGNTTIKLKGDD